MVSFVTSCRAIACTLNKFQIPAITYRGHQWHSHAFNQWCYPASLCCRQTNKKCDYGMCCYMLLWFHFLASDYRTGGKESQQLGPRVPKRRETIQDDPQKTVRVAGVAWPVLVWKLRMKRLQKWNSFNTYWMQSKTEKDALRVQLQVKVCNSQVMGRRVRRVAGVDQALGRRKFKSLDSKLSSFTFVHFTRR